MTLFIPMFIFAFSMAITPGPNNLIMLSTGVNYGLRRALPYGVGVVVGFNLLLTTIGLGLGTVIASNEVYLNYLSYGGIVFICYMAYKIATAPTEIKSQDDKKPGFIHGVLFQWINPKAWTACVGGVGAFNIAGSYSGLAAYIIISTFVIFFSLCVWAYAGSKITRYLEAEQHHRIFNIFMGTCLFLVAVYLMFLDV